MSIAITVRDVPDEVRNELAARAARSGRSLQEYLRLQLIRMAAAPSPDDWLVRIRAEVEANAPELSAAEIVSDIRADRDR